MDSEAPTAPQESNEPYRTGRDSYNYGCMDNFAGFFYYAESYKQAGDALIEWVEKQNGQADCIIHPLCFLYRQYLELILKSIIIDCQRLLGNSFEIKLTHNIKTLWKKCREFLEEVFGEQFLKDNSQIEIRIERFLSVAPSHDAFRYPIMKDKKPSFPNQHYVNVRVLGEEMNKIWSLFFGISNDLAERIKNTSHFEP